MDCKAISFWCDCMCMCVCVCVCRQNLLYLMRLLLPLDQCAERGNREKEKEKVLSQLISPSLFLSPSLPSRLLIQPQCLSSIPFLNINSMSLPIFILSLSLIYSDSQNCFMESFYVQTNRFQKDQFLSVSFQSFCSLLKQSKPCDDPQHL